MNKKFSTKKMVRISILALIGTILTIINVSAPFFPPFLRLDLGNIPAVVGAITMGPIAGLLIELLKNILHFILDSSSAGVGELANFIVGAAYIIPFGYIYQKKPTPKGYILASTIAIFFMTIIGAIFNYFLFIPLYAILFGGMDLIISMSSEINPLITDLRTLIIFAIIPFNILKGLIVSIVGYFVYKSLKPILSKL